MKTNDSIRQNTKCAQCGNSIYRVTWHYGKNRPIAEHFCNNACKAAWQRAQRESLGFTREWLLQQYVTNGRSANDIAKEIGRDSKRVWEWIKDYGIPTRRRGHNREFLISDGSGFRGKKHTDATREKIRAAAIRDGRVPYDPKVGSYMKGRKGTNTPNWKGGVTPDRQAFYSSEVWKNACKLVWHRADAKCERCGIHHNTAKTRGTFCIHHVDSFAVVERRADLDNLVLLCRNCHLWVHSKKNANGILLGKGHRKCRSSIRK